FKTSALNHSATLPWSSIVTETARGSSRRRVRFTQARAGLRMLRRGAVDRASCVAQEQRLQFVVLALAERRRRDARVIVQVD
ncbi:hypothetical protein AAHH79_37770, partial [Burkholderia pseudomallei]